MLLLWVIGINAPAGGEQRIDLGDLARDADEPGADLFAADYLREGQEQERLVRRLGERRFREDAVGNDGVLDLIGLTRVLSRCRFAKEDGGKGRIAAMASKFRQPAATRADRNAFGRRIVQPVCARRFPSC